jgi:hypothetical protein
MPRRIVNLRGWSLAWYRALLTIADFHGYSKSYLLVLKSDNILCGNDSVPPIPWNTDFHWLQANSDCQWRWSHPLGSPSFVSIVCCVENEVIPHVLIHWNRRRDIFWIHLRALNKCRNEFINLHYQFKTHTLTQRNKQRCRKKCFVRKTTVNYQILL